MGNRTFLLLVVATYFATDSDWHRTNIFSHQEFQGRRQEPGCHGEKPVVSSNCRFLKIYPRPQPQNNYMHISLNCHCRLQICAQLLNLRFILQKKYGINCEIHSLD